MALFVQVGIGFLDTAGVESAAGVEGAAGVAVPAALLARRGKLAGPIAVLAALEA